MATSGLVQAATFIHSAVFGKVALTLSVAEDPNPPADDPDVDLPELSEARQKSLCDLYFQFGDDMWVIKSASRAAVRVAPVWLVSC